MDNPDTGNNIVIVILAGGIGARFWPASTRRKPKQFLKLFGDDSMLQLARERVRPLAPAGRVLVMTNREFVPLVREQLPDIPDENIIGEPCRRDTAAAIALSACLARRRYGNPVIATVTADHLIEPAEKFRNTLAAAMGLAGSNGALYTIGVRPSAPSTAYGYLERGEPIPGDRGFAEYRVACFHEKPDAVTAAKYLSTGRFYWNSGMFVWTADAILRELERQLPGHAASMSEAAEHDRTPEWESALERAFDALQPVSIDYGVMEHAGDVRCIEADFYWNDAGGWNAIRDHYAPDALGNRRRGCLLARDARNNFVFSEDDTETVALIGVDDLVVVRAGNRTLVAPKDRADEIKQLLADSPPED